MAARAGLSTSQSSEGACCMDLPHSPQSRGSYPLRQGTESAMEGDFSESQVKSSLLEWLKVEMGKEFQGLVKEHQSLQTHPKSLGKTVRRKPSPSPTCNPKKSKKNSGTRPRVYEYPSDSEDSGSSLRGEEGKLSEEEEEVVAVQQNRLFSAELYSHMLPKVLRTLEISPRPSDESKSDPEYPRGSDRSLPRRASNQKGTPLPDIFHDAMKAEWENPAKPKSTHPIFS